MKLNVMQDTDTRIVLRAPPEPHEFDPASVVAAPVAATAKHARTRRLDAYSPVNPHDSLRASFLAERPARAMQSTCTEIWEAPRACPHERAPAELEAFPRSETARHFTCASIKRRYVDPQAESPAAFPASPVPLSATHATPLDWPHARSPTSLLAFPPGAMATHPRDASAPNMPPSSCPPQEERPASLEADEPPTEMHDAWRATPVLRSADPQDLSPAVFEAEPNGAIAAHDAESPTGFEASLDPHASSSPRFVAFPVADTEWQETGLTQPTASASPRTAIATPSAQASRSIWTSSASSQPASAVAWPGKEATERAMATIRSEARTWDAAVLHP